MELVEGVYCYVWPSHGNGCNTYAFRYSVDGRSRFLVVDPGERQVMTPTRGATRGALELLFGEMAKDGITPEQIGMIVCTHCHPDHCEAALEVKRRSGAPVAIHEGEREAFARVMAGSHNGAHGESSAEMEPDIYLDEGELLLGKPHPISLRVLHTPGHSAGSISLYWPERRVLATGDAVFYRNVGRTDFPGGDARVLRESVTKLSGLDAEYLLTGHAYGHPGVITGKSEVESNFRFVLLHSLAF